MEVNVGQSVKGAQDSIFELKGFRIADDHLRESVEALSDLYAVKRRFTVLMQSRIWVDSRRSP